MDHTTLKFLRPVPEHHEDGGQTYLTMSLSCCAQPRTVARAAPPLAPGEGVDRPINGVDHHGGGRPGPT